MLRLHYKTSGVHKAGPRPTRKCLDYPSCRSVQRDLGIPAITISFAQQNSRRWLPHTQIKNCRAERTRTCQGSVRCEVFVLIKNLTSDERHPAQTPLPPDPWRTTSLTYPYYQILVLPPQILCPLAILVGHAAKAEAGNPSVAASQHHRPYIASRPRRRKNYVSPNSNTGCRGLRQYLALMVENIFQVPGYH